MAQLFSTFALMFATGLAMGPGDPVGISDAQVETDLELRQVSIEGERWARLRAMAEFEAPVAKPPGPWAAERQVRIERSTDGLRIRVTWTLETIEAGWWTGPLVGPMPGMRVESVTWRGRDIGITRTPAGEEVALKMTAKSRGDLELVAFVPGDRVPGGVNGNFNVWLMPAVRGELRLTGAAAPEGRVPELIADDQVRRVIDRRFWAGEAQLAVNWVDANQGTDPVEGPLAVAHSSVGLTFGDAEVRGRARVSWLLRRGQLDHVTLDTAGLGRDLEVVGPNVHAWVRNGDRIDIELKDPVDGRLDIDLRWTLGLSGAAQTKLAAPRITPQQAYRTETFMQVARDGELEVLPELSGWSAVAQAELPDWAGGHIQGTATATYRRDDDDPRASFELLRFVPLSGPPVVVDVAAYEVATTDEGRNLVQARYDVRNERASHLRLELPQHSRMLGVRVNGETVTPARDASSTTANTQAWRIPLVRSLESVTGSLSFPVEVIFISEASDWKKKESRELQLPALDAPVAVSRVRVYLPPRYANRVAVGDFHRVNDFSEGAGITYGLGVGAGSAEVGRADELYRDALSSWMSNDFERAQSSLDDLGALGASNANIEGLQANLDLVQGRGEQPGDDDTRGGQSAVVSRRIKDQAKRRAADDKIALLEKAQEAEELEAQGQYDQAEQKLAEAQELGDRLALLEQSESKEQSVYNQSLSSKSASVAEKKKRKVSRESKATTHEPPPPPPEPEPTPEPELETADEVTSIPIGDATSRDFTEVVDVGLITLDHESPVEEDRRSGPAKKPRVAGNRRGGKGKAPDAKAAPEQAAASMPVTPAPDPNAALAGPVATASAVLVHVPAVGEAVLYQHMLLPEGKTLTVHLEARRHKPSKRKSK
jgi:hypothetical protein